ncbi:MAG: NlpC/P60 family protein [Chloroflexota bacterium]|nr:NlpC/P60 family protein [Chloroflexota bacterium]
MKYAVVAPLRRAGLILLTSLVASAAVGGLPSPAAHAAGGAMVVQNTGGGTVRYRSGAGVGYDVRGSLSDGAPVTVLEGPVKIADGSHWYRISTAGQVGWIDSRYLGSAPTTSKTTTTSKPTTKTTAAKPPVLTGYAKIANSQGDAVRVRSTAGGKIVATAGVGTVLKVAKGPVNDSSGTSWYQVTGGVSGWIAAAYLTSAPAPTVAKKPAPPAAKAPSKAAPTTARTGSARGATAAPANSIAGGVVGTAMNYVGSRYVFGGTTPRGFDCSGFVYYVFNKTGFGMGRSMSSELASGTHISSSQLQPGDLVYFSNTYQRGISHIGIYIGNGKMVHAGDESSGVTVSDLWSSYWAAHYTGAVRVAR